MTRLLLAILLLPSLAFAATSEYREAVLSVGTNMPGGGTNNAFTLDGTTDAIELIMTAPEAATITKVCYPYAVRTGTPPTFKIGIEGVSITTGRANTTYKTGTGECSVTFTPPASTAENDTIQCKTLTGTTCAVTAGEVLALTIRYSAGTIDIANSSSFYYRFSNAQTSEAFETYVWTVNVGVGAQSSGYEHTAMFIGDAAGRYWGNPALAYLQDFYSGTTEKALRFQGPGPTSQTFTIRGAQVWGSGPTAGESLVVTLYNGTTALKSVTVDMDQMGAGGGPIAVKVHWTPETLTYNTTYRIGVDYGATSKFLVTIDMGTGNNAYFDAWPLGKETYLSTRATGGGTAWTDVTAQRPRINLLLDEVVSAGASGGLINFNNVSGGSQ